MANVLNPEPESITLNTELETPTLEPATELDSLPRIDQPLRESTSNTETADAVTAVEPTALDADTLTEPVAEAAPAEHPTEEAALAAPQAEATPVELRELAAPAEGPPVAEPAEAAEESTIQAYAEPAHESHGLESMDDFSAALAAFEREQAAEAAAVEAYGDKVVSGTVLKATDKHLVVDVGLKSEGLVPIEQVLDHTGAVRFNPGDVIDVVIEREEPEGGYLVSFEKAQRFRVWDVIEKAANDKTPVMGTVVSRVKGGLTVDIGLKAFLPGSQLEIRPVRNLDGYLGQQIEVRVIKL
ncbi:MAG: S1 RNA-binding domain-containing protein, partial [Terracidiphilus sp.]